MITARDIERWSRESGTDDLTVLEGGSERRQRFVAFLALRHPDLLRRYLATEDGGSYAVELLMTNALAEIIRSRLRDTLAEGEQWSILEEWIRWDEDAYELINQLRPQ